VDRAAVTNRISKEGQVLTDVRYFVKNRGKTHFSLTLPEGTELWSASVNGAAVVPVKDGAASLIPLPQLADANAVLTLDLKLARAKSPNAERLTVAAPIAGAPVMLEEWKLVPDPGQRLILCQGIDHCFLHDKRNHLLHVRCVGDRQSAAVDQLYRGAFDQIQNQLRDRTGTANACGI